MVPGLPGAAIVGVGVKGLLDGFHERRLRVGQEVLVRELRDGKKTLADAAHQDEALSVIYRYLRAAQEGAARVNLTLMARVIAGQIERGNLVADEFLYYADMLATLRRGELVLLATLYRHWTSQDAVILDVEGRINHTSLRTRAELVPSYFGSEDAIFGTLSAVTRTGLVVSVAGWGSMLAYPSPVMDRLIALCPLGEVLARDP